MEKKILIVNGHPNMKNSFATKKILEEIKTKHFPKADITNVGDLYPNFQINVKEEQKKVTEHDVIILQYPFYWYEAPALLRKWIEDTMAHGFAMDSKGGKLNGKTLVVSFTGGSTEEMYRHGGPRNYELSEFMPEYILLAKFTGMKWGGFIYSGGYHMNETDPERLKKNEEKCVDHAKRLAELINKL